MKPSAPRSRVTASFNPLLPEFRADPYQTFHRLRAEAPVAWSSAPVPGFWGFWFVSRYDDVMADGLAAILLLRDIIAALVGGVLDNTLGSIRKLEPKTSIVTELAPQISVTSPACTPQTQWYEWPHSDSAPTVGLPVMPEACPNQTSGQRGHSWPPAIPHCFLACLLSG